MGNKEKTAPGGAGAGDESYQKLLEKMKTVKPGKECRELHRKLRKYGRGMFFTDRYPNFLIWLSAVAAAVSLLVFILKMLGTGS